MCKGRLLYSAREQPKNRNRSRKPRACKNKNKKKKKEEEEAKEYVCTKYTRLKNASNGMSSLSECIRNAWKKMNKETKTKRNI